MARSPEGLDMSYYKRNKGLCGTGRRLPERPENRLSEQIIRGEDFSLSREVEYIIGLASRGETRVVTAGLLVFFSTSEGDAWVLDVEDNLALCLMREFERREVVIRDDPKTFAIQWEASFTVDQGCFVVTWQPGRVTAYATYPVSDIQQAIRRARRAAG